jgi:hypothetical protein
MRRGVPMAQERSSGPTVNQRSPGTGITSR